MKAKIFEIKRFAVHDGDGIRTTVFFKGCPLRCVWCHNPEGLSAKYEVAFYEHKCIGCGECQKENFSVCDCLGGARVEYGKEVSVSELLPRLLEDKEFYENSGGGVTLSGGECLMQVDFCAELLKVLKSQGIHTAVDTCGFVSQKNLDKVIPYTDVFLYDLKAIDEDIHIKCTGVSTAQILENLRYLDNIEKHIEIRIPYVPGYNSGQIQKMADLLKTIKNILKIRLLPYHNYSETKYKSLGLISKMPKDLPSDEEIASAKEILKQSGHIII
jgi:pyruvate formate lyase activating enzyme